MLHPDPRLDNLATLRVKLRARPTDKLDLENDRTREDLKRSWLRRRVEGAIRGGLTRTYETIKVDPGRFLMQLRVAHGLPLATFHGVYTLPIERLDDVAESVIRGGMKLAAAEGAGFGLGGILTIVPDLGILSAITMRTIQKLSLIYGFELNSDDEIAELWIAAASAAGVDISRELLEKRWSTVLCRGLSSGSPLKRVPKLQRSGWDG